MRFFSLIFFLLGMSTFIQAQLEVCPLFANHAVLQRDQPLRVWGKATPNTEIAVVFRDGTYTGTTDPNGRWSILLPAQDAGGPHRMVIQAGSERIDLQNVMIGDVWLCSGQSNMEWTVANSANAEAEMKAARDRLIRHYKVPLLHAEQPEEDLAGGKWEVANPLTVGDFTAVGYFFARQIRRHQDIPIGLLNSSWSGSRIEPWMNMEAFGGVELDSLKQFAKRQAVANQQAAFRALQERFPQLSKQQRGKSGRLVPWAAPDFSDDDWEEVPVPGFWEGAGFADFDGVAWYRTNFFLNPDQVAGAKELGLGKIDDSDEVWINGVRVGGMENAWNVARRYPIPAGVLHAGTNTIAVRVEDYGGGGGIGGEAEEVYLDTKSGRISLARTWKFKLDALLAATMDFELSPSQIPTLLYNKMIFPLQDFPIKGVLWYQGESNANTEEDALAYRQSFQQLIRQWRDEWKQPEMPFLFVQLANFFPAEDQPQESAWAILRESQAAALDLPNVGQAVAIDIGEADDIHPRNKQEVGRRLALAARKIAYGEELISSGPIYQNHEVKDGRIIVSFEHLGGGLRVDNPYGYVNAFAIAGADKQFVWAKAILRDNQVVVWHDAIKEPQYLRYAWAGNPADANLYNAAGLPAAPFQTH